MAAIPPVHLVSVNNFDFFLFWYSFFFSDDDSMACSCFLLTALYHGSLHQRGTAAGLGPCRLLSRMPLQSSSQDSRRRCDQLLPRCVLWQAVNRMCSHDGLSSTPGWDTYLRDKILNLPLGIQTATLTFQHIRTESGESALIRAWHYAEWIM